VGIPTIPDYGPSLGEWYSMKTSRPVVGFLGANVLKAYRIEIDYADSAIYFEKNVSFDPHDMDIVGIGLRPEKDGDFTVIGIVTKDGKPVVQGIEPGDILLSVDDFAVTGNTFGTVVDALRGKPGDSRILELERNGEKFKVRAEVMRLL